MQVKSYVGLDEVRFGSSRDVAAAVLGPPRAERTLREGQVELEYSGVILRYDSDESGLAEITIVPDAGLGWFIEDIPISWDQDFLRRLCLRDGKPMASSGFVVLFNLGIALSGFAPDEEDQLAVTAFRRGYWDHFKDQLLLHDISRA